MRRSKRVRPLSRRRPSSSRQGRGPLAFFAIARVSTIVPTDQRFVALRCSIGNKRLDGVTMGVTRIRVCRGSIRCVLLACLVAAPLGAAAQATTNPSLNAQLLVGARQGDVAQVERVVAAGAAVSSRNRLGKTALFLAAEKGNLAFDRGLVDFGTVLQQQLD